METLILIGILVGLGTGAYKAGKSAGSRKGFGIGRYRGRGRR